MFSVIEQLARLQLINCQITLQSVQHLFLWMRWRLAPSARVLLLFVVQMLATVSHPAIRQQTSFPVLQKICVGPQPYRALRCRQGLSPVQGGCVKSLSSTRAGGVSSRHEADYRFADGGHPRGDHYGGEGAESARQGPAWCGPAFGDMKRVLGGIAQHCASAVLCLQRQSERVLTLKGSVAHM